MDYVYSALLLHSAKQPVTEESVKKVLQAAGGSPEDARVKALIASLEGVNIDDAIKQAAVVQVAAAPTAGAGEAKKDEKASAAEEAKKEEDTAAGLAALFG